MSGPLSRSDIYPMPYSSLSLPPSLSLSLSLSLSPSLSLLPPLSPSLPGAGRLTFRVRRRGPRSECRRISPGTPAAPSPALLAATVFANRGLSTDSVPATNGLTQLPGPPHRRDQTPPAAAPQRPRPTGTGGSEPTANCALLL